MSAFPLSAPFTRVDAIDPVELLLEATLPVPVPVPRMPHPSGLPEHVVLTLDERELRIADAAGRTLEAWPRGALVARVQELFDDWLELALRWPEGGRAGRLHADATPEAVELAEQLARDTRIAAGSDAEADDALRALAAATLPEPLRREHHAALRAVTVLLGPDERPVALAVALRGLSTGIAMLTDRALCWWGGGRKDPLVLSRAAIAKVRADQPGGVPCLVVEDRAGRATELRDVRPSDRAAELVALIAAELPEPDGLEALLGAEPEATVVWQLRRDLEAIRATWEDGERGELLAVGFVGVKDGALVLSDRRLLWHSRKADPIVLDRTEIAGAETASTFGVTRLDLRLHGGGRCRFDAVEPRPRAEAFRAALAG